MSRQRITITIRDDLLRALDRTIDDQHIRNRSHALEVALSRSLELEAKQAIILASGKGVKMRPFTYEIPKPLIPVNGKPLLEHSLNLLRHYGIRDITITVSHLAQKITDHFGNGSKYGLKLNYVREPRPLGTGSSLLAARRKLTPAPFILLYGDVLLDLDLADFLHTHQQNRPALGTLALTSVSDPSAFGAVKMRGNHIVEFAEKPASPEASRLIFAGCAAFDYAIFRHLSKFHRFSLEQDAFPRLVSQGKLNGYPFAGQWFDVSTHEVYARVLKHWQPYPF